MNIVLWILQVLLAALFLWHGLLFLNPPPELVEIMEKEFPLWFRIFLGVAEVLAAIGLTLPGILRIQPRMIPVTALCLMILMVCATVLHLTRGESSSAATTALVFVVLGFVGYMRWKIKPVSKRVEARKEPARPRPYGPSGEAGGHRNQESGIRSAVRTPHSYPIIDYR